ncbi:MAG: GNAT family N-acetyltransferase [Bdellovibrionales bacterium]|nr:GNAT family N-acetyltransferase [Bdellovibrionales bacterium]
MIQKFSLDSISVRDLSELDIPHAINYWYSSPEGFIESIGVDPKKMGTAEETQKGLESKIFRNKELKESKLNALTITYQNKPIGFHSINPLIDDDYGIFHAHIWDQNFRGKGIGTISYPLALRVFMDRFNLKRILFKTPSQNTAAIRVKEKIGFRAIGEEKISFGIIQDGTLAKVFEVTREEILKVPSNIKNTPL